jgi:hypothetical protein
MTCLYLEAQLPAPPQCRPLDTRTVMEFPGFPRSPRLREAAFWTKDWASPPGQDAIVQCGQVCPRGAGLAVWAPWRPREVGAELKIGCENISVSDSINRPSSLVLVHRLSSTRPHPVDRQHVSGSQAARRPGYQPGHCRSPGVVSSQTRHGSTDHKTRTRAGVEPSTQALQRAWLRLGG